MVEKLLTCTDVSELLSIRPATVRAWTRQGRLPYVKLNGRSVRYRMVDVERLIQNGLRPSLPTGAQR